MDQRMNAFDYSDNEFDKVVLEEFPFPIAVAYKRTLEADVASQRVERCLMAVRFVVRSLAFGVVIKYLQDPRTSSNIPELNDRIRDDFISPGLRPWIDLLEHALAAFEGARDTFFIPELYDLYWGSQESNQPSRRAFWELLYEIAANERDLDGGHLTADTLSDSLLAALRRMLRYLDFIRNYQLWFVRAERTDLGRLDIQVFRGQEKTVRYPSTELLSQETSQGDRVVAGRFYLYDSGNKILELHPLIVNRGHVEALETGMYMTYIQRDDEAEIIYLMLEANKSESIRPSADQPSRDLVREFTNLYERQLELKRRALISQIPVNIENIREACSRMSDGQTQSVKDKYIEAAYVRRHESEAMVRAFMESGKPAFVVTGNVGVGKSNLLYNFFRNASTGSDNRYIVLWRDGARLETSRSFNRTLINEFADILQIGEIPLDEDQLNRMVRNLLSQHFSGSYTLVVIFDGINENSHPYEAAEVVNRFVSERPRDAKIKVIISSRPEVWRRARSQLSTRFHEGEYFLDIGDAASLGTLEVDTNSHSVVLTRYDGEELPVAFQRYASHYRIQEPDLQRLSPSLRMAIREPLLLRLTCEAYTGERIPDELRSGDIIERLITAQRERDRYNLNEDVFEFLQSRIVPQFLSEDKDPVTVLRTRDLQQVRFGPYTLDQLVVEDTQGRLAGPLNENTQRLIDTGWLLLTGTRSNYQLSFKYEYFYDYFVGRRLRELYDEKPTVKDKVEFFEKEIGYLNRAPFLWGAMRRLLEDLLDQGQYELIERLGITSDVFQFELLSSVITEHYSEHDAALRKVLLNWLDQLEAELLSGTLAASIAVKRQDEEVLKACLVHSNEDARLIAAQSLHEIWVTNPELSPMLLKYLAGLSNSLNPFKRKATAANLGTLFRASVLLALHEYADKGNNHGKGQSAARLVQETWQPILKKFLFLSDSGLIERFMKPLRKRVLAISTRMGIRMFTSLERPGFTFSFEDIMEYFPSTARKQEIAERMIRHLDVAATTNGDHGESIEDLVAFIEELAHNNEGNIVIAYMVMAALLAHTYANTIETARALDGLLKRLEEYYEPTTDINKPTASLLYVVSTYPFLNLSYRELYESNESDALEILEIFRRANIQRELRYRNRWILDCGKTLRVNGTEELLFSYDLGLEKHGPDTLEEIIAFDIRMKDHEQIRWTVAQIAIGMHRYNLPEAGLTAFRDFIRILARENYFRQIDESEFWKQAADDLIAYSGKYSYFLRHLPEMFNDDDLPADFKARMLNAGNLAKSEVQAGEAFAWSFGDALRDEDNPFIRERLKVIFRAAGNSKSVHEAFIKVFEDLAEVIYGKPVI